MIFGLDENSRVCIYLRKSRQDRLREEARTRDDGDREFDTLARHEKILRDLAERNGLRISHVYREVKSGELLENRPEALAMLSAVWDGEWDAVLVVEVERLGRGAQGDQGKIVTTLRHSVQHGEGTKIVTPFKVYDPRSEADMEYIEFGLFMSARELATIKRRLYQGKLSSVMEGQYIGTDAPFGYNKTMKGREHTLEPNEYAVEVVWIFEMAAYGGMSMNRIARLLNERDIPTPKTSDKWTAAAVGFILANEVYTGKIIFGKQKIITYADDDLDIKKKIVKCDDYLIVDGLHEALVSEETWCLANENRRSRVPLHFGSSLSNPFAGVLECGRCGYKMRINRNAHTNEIRFCHSRASDDECGVHSINWSRFIEELRKAVMADIREMGSLIKKIEHNELDPQREEMRVRLTEKISDIDRSVMLLFDRLDRGIVQEEDFVLRRKTLAQRKEIAISELSSLDDQLDLESAVKRRDALRSVLALLNAGGLEAEAFNTLLKKYVERIEYNTDAEPYARRFDVSLQIFLKGDSRSTHEVNPRAIIAGKRKSRFVPKNG